MPSEIPLTLTPGSDGLYGHGYEPASQTLAVEYQTNHNDLTYHYLGVPAATAAALEAAPSKGAFVARNIKKSFECQRVPKG